jgi:hypothetical protein
VTTTNKFSALSTEDDEDTEIDETREQPGEDRDRMLVPDGTIPTMGVVPPGVALQDPLSFPEMTTGHLQPRGFQQSEEYLQHIRPGHATKNPNCMECVLGGQQATKTPFAKATDTRMPADEGFAAACDLPEDDPDAPGGKTYEVVSKLMRDQGLQGDPKEFIPGYYKELHTVTTLRLKPVTPEVAAYIRSKKLAVRLKMLLEVKKDNRRKGRLVLQGFRAPAWWKVGPTDSPVVATSALRALIFRRDRVNGQHEI